MEVNFRLWFGFKPKIKKEGVGMPNMIVYLPCNFKKNYVSKTWGERDSVSYDKFMTKLADTCAEALAEAYNVANGTNLGAENSTVRFQEIPGYNRGMPDMLFLAFFGKTGLDSSVKKVVLSTLKGRLNDLAMKALDEGTWGCGKSVGYEFANVQTCGFWVHGDKPLREWGLG